MLAGYFVVIGLFYILGSRLSLFKPVFMMSAAIILLGFLASMRIRGDSRPTHQKEGSSSTGVSVNHFITILVALFGGWIWKTLGIETLFMLSAVLGMCNSAYAATIKTRSQTVE